LRKFLVVVDSTPECMNALRFAARRAAKTNGGLVMVYVIEPEEFQHWIGVQNVIRDEARREAEERLEVLADEVKALSGVMPEFAIREGEKREEVLAQIAEDQDIGLLVLGAGVSGEGPGPLVQALANKYVAKMRIPVTIVPGSLTLEEIDAVC
jgi:nucleotide-binding universal stress UspA family protein